MRTQAIRGCSFKQFEIEKEKRRTVAIANGQFGAYTMYMCDDVLGILRCPPKSSDKTHFQFIVGHIVHVQLINSFIFAFYFVCLFALALHRGERLDYQRLQVFFLIFISMAPKVHQVRSHNAKAHVDLVIYCHRFCSLM